MCDLNIYKENINQINLIYKRIINDSNIKLFTNTIENISWENVLLNENRTESFNEFSNIYSTAYETNLPLKQKVIKRNIDKGKSPWMTQCIAKSVMTKNKLCKTYLKNPSKRNGKKYKRYKNKLNHVIKIAKKTYYEEQLIEHKHDTRMTWRTLNEVMNKKKTNKGLLKESVGNNPTDISHYL